MDLEKELRDRLAATSEVAFAVVFGSRGFASTDTARSDSDWDVGVYLAQTLTGRERFDLHLRLDAELSHLGDIDIVVLNDASPLLAQRALLGRRLVIKDEVAYVRFFVRIAGLAGDESVWRQLHMSARARRLEEGTFGRP